MALRTFYVYRGARRMRELLTTRARGVLHFTTQKGMALEYASQNKEHGMLLEATIMNFIAACRTQAEMVALVPAHYYKHNGPERIDHDEVFKWYGWDPARISPRIIRRFSEIVVRLKSAGRFQLPARVIARRTDGDTFWGGGFYHRSVWNSHHRESSLVKRKKRKLRKLERQRESIAAEIKLRERGCSIFMRSSYLLELDARLAELTRRLKLSGAESASSTTSSTGTGRFFV